MFKALDPHEQPLNHGCRVCHTHLLGRTPHVGLLPIKDPLHQQPVQDSVNVPYSSPPVPHPPSRLHLGKPDEVPEMEVVGLVMVPVFSLAIHPLDQGVSSGIWTCVHGRAVCQEIGLVTFMFFFELFFLYVSSSISFYVSLTNLFSIILFPYLLITQDTQDEGEARFRFH